MKRFYLFFLCSIFALVLGAQSYRGGENFTTPEQELNELYCSGLFKTTHGNIIEVASNDGARAYMNILDWLEGRVAGLQVFTTMAGVRVPVIRGGVPGIFIDEMQISADFLNSLNTADIAIIKVIKTPFFGGFNGANGAIAIYTLGGEEEEDAEHSD